MELEKLEVAQKLQSQIVSNESKVRKLSKLLNEGFNCEVSSYTSEKRFFATCNIEHGQKIARQMVAEEIQHISSLILELKEDLKNL